MISTAEYVGVAMPDPVIARYSVTMPITSWESRVTMLGQSCGRAFHKSCTVRSDTFPLRIKLELCRELLVVEFPIAVSLPTVWQWVQRKNTEESENFLELAVVDDLLEIGTRFPETWSNSILIAAGSIPEDNWNESHRLLVLDGISSPSCCLFDDRVVMTDDNTEPTKKLDGVQRFCKVLISESRILL